MIGNTTETGSLMSTATTMGFFFLIVCLVVAGVGWFYLRMKSKDDTLRMVLESLQSIPSNVDRAASMDTIYRKHHTESIDANNRIVNRVPKQIESISQAQTQTVEGVFELTNVTQSLGERVDVLARSLAGSDHLTRVEQQVHDSHARGEQQHASAVKPNHRPRGPCSRSLNAISNNNRRLTNRARWPWPPPSPRSLDKTKR
jgi:hypothetical protein